MKDLTIRDIDWLQFIDNEGRLKVSALRLYLIQQSIYLRESIKNNHLFAQEWNKEQKEAVIKFLAWYYDS